MKNSYKQQHALLFSKLASAALSYGILCQRVAGKLPAPISEYYDGRFFDMHGITRKLLRFAYKHGFGDAVIVDVIEDIATPDPSVAEDKLALIDVTQRILLTMINEHAAVLKAANSTNTIEIQRLFSQTLEQMQQRFDELSGVLNQHREIL